MREIPAGHIRQCTRADAPKILEIINRAAVAYRDAIPEHCLHEPYMSAEELRHELASGVSFVGMEQDGALAAVMGVQRVRDATLIRHAYVIPEAQGQGIGAALLRHLTDGTSGQLLVGTWDAARWAIRFYERHGFELVEPSRIEPLLRAYWNISQEQAAASVVLARPPLS